MACITYPALGCGKQPGKPAGRTSQAPFRYNERAKPASSEVRVTDAIEVAKIEELSGMFSRRILEGNNTTWAGAASLTRATTVRTPIHPVRTKGAVINTALIVMDMLQLPTTVLHCAQHFSQIDHFRHYQMATVTESLPYPAEDRTVH